LPDIHSTIASEDAGNNDPSEGLSARRGGVDPGNRPPLVYDAFLSYSSALDGKLAPTLQGAVERYAKPWYKLRTLRIFRDTTNLSISPDLWTGIEDALRWSRYLIL
jgi:hypothetical protein